jgi:hypothetical protein
MASSVPAARTALYDGLLTLRGPAEPLEGVGVYRTGVWQQSGANDRILILNATDIRRDVVALATSTPFREEFTLNVAVEVYRRGPAEDVDVVEDRLWALITAVEQYVMSDKTLGGAVSKCVPADVNEQAGPSSESEDTVLAMATLRLECMTARVFLN